MLATIENIILTITDPLLNWLLLLPRDLALLIVAVLTGVILTQTRKWATDQDHLGRCAADKRRLKELIREAKRNRDREAAGRYRRTLGQLGGQQFKAEGKPLLYAVVPIALVAVWAFARLAFHPVPPGETVTLNAYFGLPRIGERVHLLPQESVNSANGWIQQVRPVVEEDFAFGVFAGMASWEVAAEPSDEPYTMTIRFAGKGYDIPLRVGGRLYANPIVFVDAPAIEALTVDLEEYRPLGFIPGIPMLMLQAWVVGYLILVIPLSLIIKRIMRVE